MSAERLAAGIIAACEHFNTEHEAAEDIAKALGDGSVSPAAANLATLVQNVVSAYMGETNLDVAVTARELITLVANQGRGRAKEFTMYVPDPPGEGDWRCIVHPYEEERTPAIIMPDKVARLKMPRKPRLVT
jgi:hypothetical protein